MKINESELRKAWKSGNDEIKDMLESIVQGIDFECEEAPGINFIQDRHSDFCGLYSKPTKTTCGYPLVTAKPSSKKITIDPINLKKFGYTTYVYKPKDKHEPCGEWCYVELPFDI